MSSLRTKRILLAVGAFMLFSLVVPELRSQDAAAPAAPAADPLAEGAAAADGEEVKEPTTLMDMIIGGGIFMIPIGVLSLWAITLAVFMALQLSKGKYIPRDLKEEIMGYMSEVKVRSSIDAAAQDSSYLGRMIVNAYPQVDATDTETLGRAKVEDAMADFMVRENLGTMTYIGYFSVIAQGATMLGLFGTVAGMVLAFDSMGLSGGSDPGALAANISLALITTAGGLVVAIPSIFLFYYYKNRFNYMVSEAQQVVINGLEAAVMAINADHVLARVPEGIAEL
ncbi:MAG: MotA/TolQ/ExbB proton channel family protein [Verrucomicrobiales bacterium]